MTLRNTFTVAYAMSLASLPLAALAGTIEGIAVCTLVAGVSYALRDYFAPEPDSINVMTCYAAFAALWFGLGNLVGYVVDAEKYPQFHSYDVPEFLFEAQVLAALGAVVPMITYDLLKARRGWRARRALPPVGFEVSDRDLLAFSLGLLTLGVVTQFVGLQFGFLGTLGTLINLGPVLAIFIISSRWRSPKPTTLPRWSQWLALGMMIFQVAVALLFSNMRNTLIWPVAAFFLPFVLRKRLTMTRVAIGILFVAGFSVAFKAIGEVRGQMFGEERLAYILQRPGDGEASAPEDDGDTLGLATLAARLSTFNQLTQVIRLVHDDGFYEGETIGYAVYVFIPRAIWPEKPEIAPGQWFARKLGHGMELGGTQFSNAINMTIPGELYLNYGWLAVVLGMAGLGLLYFQFWELSRFFEEDGNPVGLTFTYILFSQAMFNGSHLGGVINLILWYLSLLALTWGLTFVFTRLQGAPEPLRAPEHEQPQSAPV